jgi:ubiquitin carboxyl-terminal hydrolase 4/11/15
MPKGKQNRASKTEVSTGPTETNEVLTEEANQVRELLQNMSKNVATGSKWYVINQAWINKWQTYVGFEDGEEPQPNLKPGKINNEGIIVQESKDAKGQYLSTSLPEMGQKSLYMNYQLQRGLTEGTDFMVVDDNIHNLWSTKYGEDIGLERYGIVDESGESVVELYFRQINLLPLPNAKLFKLYKGKDVQSQPAYISRSATMDALAKKVCRLLSTHLYVVLKNKAVMISSVRLWRANEDLHKLKDLDQKYQNYTHAQIDADILNLTDEQKKKLIHETNISDTDTIIAEAPKGADFVFQPQKGKSSGLGAEDEEAKEAAFEDPLKGKDVQSNDVGEISALDLSNLFKKNARRGLTGLQNLGNTCFMNSGLQCLSNTVELTKFFLFKLHEKDINTDNPLGMNGRLAEAYHSLLQDMWLGKEPKTAPYDLKRVLGKRVARFSGYGQQDACELLNYLLDLIHEDLNRVKKKPYVEMPESDGRPDEELSNLFWGGFLARNQSIIVDLMYGQLKSTVRCLECHNISVSFDPFLTLSLPISRPSKFAVGLVPFEVFRNVMADDDDEDDEDYKDPR